jgi:hypothetical protein
MRCSRAILPVSSVIAAMLVSSTTVAQRREPNHQCSPTTPTLWSGFSLTSNKETFAVIHYLRQREKGVAVVFMSTYVNQ